jgi:threonine/homoserine/homoserine lactone efflux protein
MLNDAIGSMLPAALAVALSPFPIVGVVLILSGADGRRNGPMFAIGWVAGLTILSILGLLVFGGADDSESTTRTVVDLLRIAAGSALIVLAVKKLWGKIVAKAEPKTPGWMDSLNGASALKALSIGLLLASANPKSIVLTLAAITSIIESGVHDRNLLIAIIAFIVVGSCTVVGSVLAQLLGGKRAETALGSVRDFMIANNAVIMAIVFLVMGASILGDGIAGLGD